MDLMNRVAPQPCSSGLVIIMGIKIMDIAIKMIVPREMDDGEKINGKKEATESRITQNMTGNFARNHRLPRMMSHTILLSNRRQMCIPLQLSLDEEDDDSLPLTRSIKAARMAKASQERVTIAKE